MVIFLAILAGAISYACAQILWYAPFAFGPHRLALTRETEDRVVDSVMYDSGRGARILMGIVLPAVLSSFALVTLKVLTDRMFLSPVSFLLAVFVLGIAVALPKYVGGLLARRKPGQLMLIQDGALIFGLLSAAFAIIGSTV